MTIYPSTMLQNIFSPFIQPVLCSLIFVLLGAGFSVAAEIDDSSLFVEAFGAYQKKDYLLAIEKIGMINQLFPDTQLRDVALLLLARSGLRSGDYELAAKSIVQFNSEFSDNPLKAGTEDDLQRLGARWQKGEKLSPAIPLRTAAQMIRSEQAALERPAEEKVAKGLLPVERTAQIKTSAVVRRAPESPVPGNDPREKIRAVISMSANLQTVIAAGQRGALPFEVANLGPSDDIFLLEASAPPEYEALLTTAGRPDVKTARATIATAVPFKGSIMFRMPPDKVDGHKAVVSLRVVSEKDRHLIQARDTQIITAAPLIRAVARPEKQILAPGERTRYRITVLNAGTLPAVGLTVRVDLPAQIEFLGASRSPDLRETAGAVSFRLEKLATGTLSEFILDVKVREDALSGQELRSRVEVVNDQLQTKGFFTSTAVVVQGTPAHTQQ